MGVIGPRDQAKLAALADLTRAAQTLYGLTEQFAAARVGEDQIAQQIKRRCGRFKRVLMTAGFAQLAQLAGDMEHAAGRSSSQPSKTRILRESISAIRNQVDMEERSIRKASSGAAGGEVREPPAGEKP